MPLLVSLSHVREFRYGTNFITEKVLEFPMTFFYKSEGLKKIKDLGE